MNNITNIGFRSAQIGMRATTGGPGFGIQRRFSFQPSNPKKIAFINGMRGQLAPEIATTLIKDGYQIIGLTRNVRGLLNTSRITHLRSSSEYIKDPDFWTRVILKYAKDHTQDPYEQILLVNTVGSSSASNGQSLSDINEKPAIAMAKGLEMASSEMASKMNFVHMSSIAASILGDDHPYSAVKQRTDLRLLNEHKNIRPLCLRLGLVTNPITPCGRIDRGHSYSLEQIVAFSDRFFRRVIVAGSGKQILQPVSSQDIAKAVLNAPQLTEPKTVEAVGPDSRTQLDLLRMLLKISGRDRKFYHAPLDALKKMADATPWGRFAPYAFLMLRKLEDPNHNKPFPTEPFRQIVGGSLKRIEDQYQKGEKPLVFSRPPIGEHLSHTIPKLVKDEGCRRNCLEAIKLVTRHILESRPDPESASP